MKNFILNNWFQLMIGTSLVTGSTGFLIYSATNATAQTSTSNSNASNIPVNKDGSITVKLSQDQLDELKTSLAAGGNNANAGKVGIQNVRIVEWKENANRNKGFGDYTGIPVYVINK